MLIGGYLGEAQIISASWLHHWYDWMGCDHLGDFQR